MTAVAHLTGEETRRSTSSGDASTVRELETVSEARLEGTEDRVIKMPLVGTMYFEATGAIPNRMGATRTSISTS